MSDFAVKLKLTGDSGDLQSAIDKARQKLDDMEKSVEQQPKDWKNAGAAIKDYSGNITHAGKKTLGFVKKAAKITGIAGAISSALGGIGFGLLIKQTIESAEQLRQHSLNLNISAESLSKWQYAANKVGIDGEKMADIFKDINDRVGDFARTGAGPLVDVMEQTNLKIEDLVKLSPEDQLLAIYDAIDNIAGISFSEKTFFLEALAGDASRLIPLLDNNAEKLKALSNRAVELNVVMTDLDVEMLHQAQKNSDALDTSIESVSNKFTIAMSPAISTVTKYIDDLALAHGGWGDVATKVAASIIEGIADIIDFVGDANKAYQKLKIISLDALITANKANAALNPLSAQASLSNVAALAKSRAEIQNSLNAQLKIEARDGTRGEQFIQYYKNLADSQRKQAEAAIANRKANKKTSNGLRTLGKPLADAISGTNKLTESNRELEAQLLKDAYTKHSENLEKERFALTATAAELYEYELRQEQVGKAKQKYSEADIRNLVNYKAQTEAIKASNEQLKKSREEAEQALKDQETTYQDYLHALEVERLLNLGLIDQARDLELSREISDEKLRKSIIEKENYNKKTREATELEQEFADILSGEVTSALTGMVDTGNTLLDKLIAKLIETSLTGKSLAGIFGGSSTSNSGGGFLDGLSSLFSGLFKSSAQYATGGYHSGGYRLVGERGPELEATGAARIFNVRDTATILGGGNKSMPKVTINNYTSAAIEQDNVTQDSNGDIQIDLITKQIEGGIARNINNGNSPITPAMRKKLKL